MATGNPITTPANGISVVEVDPVPRIEGHLGIKVEVSNGTITEADAHGNLFRGFENFLIGREVNDAITFTQRICGVCPVPHGLTATYAADAVLGYSQGHITFAEDTDGYGVPKKAVHIRNLVLASEFLMSSITHFYHLAAPSYVQGPAIPPWTPYFHDDDYAEKLRSLGRGINASGVPSASGDRGVLPLKTQFGTNSANVFSADLWSTVIRSYVKALRIRRLTFEAGALFAGRMPMTSCYVGGGVTNNYTQPELQNRCDKFRDIMQEVGRFIIKEYVPIALALGVLYTPYDNTHNGGSGYGAGVGNFLSWGAFPNPDNHTLLLSGGAWIGGSGGSLSHAAANKAQVLSQFVASSGVPAKLKEDITHARYTIYSGDASAYTSGAAYPGAVSRTQPHRASGYSYLKAPRWDGHPCEVGPLARLVVAGYYPIDGSLLATNANLGPAYLAYTRAFDPGVTGIGVDLTGLGLGWRGLDPRMIEPDIAVALVREGLAEVYLPNGTAVNDPDAILADYNNAIITGAVAMWVITLKGGLSTMDRLRARALESLVLVQAMIGAYNKTNDTFGSTSWIASLRADTGPTWRDLPIPTGTRQGWGAVEAPRGALMHQVTIHNGKITKYQCIVPTTWNGSPKDNANKRGPIEQAMIGVPYAARTGSFTKQNGDPGSGQGGVEVLRVAQSFDPCIACAVH